PPASRSPAGRLNLRSARTPGGRSGSPAAATQRASGHPAGFGVIATVQGACFSSASLVAPRDSLSTAPAPRAPTTVSVASSAASNSASRGDFSTSEVVAWTRGYFTSHG